MNLFGTRPPCSTAGILTRVENPSLSSFSLSTLQTVFFFFSLLDRSVLRTRYYYRGPVREIESGCSYQCPNVISSLHLGSSRRVHHHHHHHHHHPKVGCSCNSNPIEPAQPTPTTHAMVIDGREGLRKRRRIRKKTFSPFPFPSSRREPEDRTRRIRTTPPSGGSRYANLSDKDPSRWSPAFTNTYYIACSVGQSSRLVFSPSCISSKAVHPLRSHRRWRARARARCCSVGTYGSYLG